MSEHPDKHHNSPWSPPLFRSGKRMSSGRKDIDLKYWLFSVYVISLDRHRVLKAFDEN